MTRGPLMPPSAGQHLTIGVDHWWNTGRYCSVGENPVGEHQNACFAPALAPRNWSLDGPASMKTNSSVRFGMARHEACTPCPNAPQILGYALPRPAYALSMVSETDDFACNMFRAELRSSAVIT